MIKSLAGYVEAKGGHRDRSAERAAVVRESWASASRDRPLLEAQLRLRLQREPALALVLGDSLAAAAARLAHAVDVAVRHLDRLYAEADGCSFAAASPGSVGLALIEALEACLGTARFTATVREAWEATWLVMLCRLQVPAAA